MNKIDYSFMKGKIYGKWTVLNVSEHATTLSKVLCKCECGREQLVSLRSLIENRTHSCLHCRNHFKKHGMRFTRLYVCYRNMRDRCENPNNTYYYNYGGRGITVCDEWKTFEPFMKWALANGYTDELTIDKIDNNKGYSPSNCRWVTRDIQAYNQRKRKNSSSKYKGVCWSNRENKWLVQVRLNGHNKFCGYFHDEKEAALHYNDIVKQLNLNSTLNQFNED